MSFDSEELNNLAEKVSFTDCSICFYVSRGDACLQGSSVLLSIAAKLSVRIELSANGPADAIFQRVNRIRKFSGTHGLAK